jgi:hypothetical protein
MKEADYTKLFLLFGNITTAAILIPVMLAIWHWRYLNIPLKIIFWYRVFAITFNLLEQVFVTWVRAYRDISVPLLNEWNIHDTNFLTILYHLNTVFMVGWFYSLLLPSKPYGILVKRVSIGLLIGILINYLFIEGFRVYGIFNPNATAVFTFSIAAFYLFYVYTSHLMLPVGKNPYFWISAGLVIPYLIGFYLFIIGNFTHEEDYGLFVAISIIKNGFMIIGQIFIAIGFRHARYARYLTAKTYSSIV